jgi:hypothetical protein
MHLKTYLTTYFLQQAFFFFSPKPFFSGFFVKGKKTHKKISLQFIYLLINSANNWCRRVLMGEKKHTWDSVEMLDIGLECR